MGNTSQKNLSDSQDDVDSQDVTYSQEEILWPLAEVKDEVIDRESILEVVKKEPKIEAIVTNQPTAAKEGNATQ